MSTPFDAVIQHIVTAGYHNHRLEEHSNILSKCIFADLLKACAPLRRDVQSGRVREWLNVRAPGARERKIDLFIGESQERSTKPDMTKLRICVENKSVITAHRNRDARFDDLNETMKVVYAVKQEAVIVATILVGVAPNVLNIPDAVKKQYKNKLADFERLVLPRLSTGDATLWNDFAWAVSSNKVADPAQTVAKFRLLSTRPPGHTHIQGYDYVLIVPVYVDNVNPPYVALKNDLRIRVEVEYRNMITAICKAYRARWHL